MENNLVVGETLRYHTRHHWIVLLGPLFASLLLGAAGIALLVGSIASKAGGGQGSASAAIGAGGMAIIALLLLFGAAGALVYGIAKRNATEMAVTNKRVLIKTGMASRRTLDLMLSRVESIGVEETVIGRMLGYGTVVVRGTGGTPETFVMVQHPQGFRRAVQEQTGRE